MDLLIGCGNSRDRRIQTERKEWVDLKTLDMDPSCKPDIVHDLNELPYPFDDNSIAELHAYEVLEHLGRQGEWKGFFAEFNEFHRILKPNGLLCATVPCWDSHWAWGDPGHTRVITPGTLAFLSQAEYTNQLGKTSMTDYRGVYKGDFECIFLQKVDESIAFILRAVK